MAVISRGELSGFCCSTCGVYAETEEVIVVSRDVKTKTFTPACSDCMCRDCWEKRGKPGGTYQRYTRGVIYA
jgi:hypothetical protein